MKGNNEWLTIEQTMAYLQVKSKSTIYSIAKRYGIRQSKLLSIPYFSRADIDKALADNAVKLGSAA